jgi:hypothetical protein
MGAIVAHLKVQNRLSLPPLLPSDSIAPWRVYVLLNVLILKDTNSFLSRAAQFRNHLSSATHGNKLVSFKARTSLTDHKLARDRWNLKGAEKGVTDKSAP